MQIKEQKIKELNILYDADEFVKPEPRLFELTYLEEAGLLERCVAAGRGAVIFFSWQSKRYVLRHYQRGGLMATLLGDRYFFGGVQRSRAWREWLLLQELHQLGLPVPQPLAARVIRSGLFYRADLITAQIEGTQTLGECLLQAGLSASLWREVGVVVRRFHDLGVFHADLNLNNILLDNQGAVYLLDFDKGERRRVKLDWQQANLARLLRSLQKQKRARPETQFSAFDWQVLLAGYGA
ncbi:MAG: 3-deoxy-D-manno-octulosonic acid kinase [Gammaproteobacteria bacterium]|nr:3-deoxy-D-manno-octulosonic acid kinase [Gammaproteobacteria bacterium]